VCLTNRDSSMRSTVLEGAARYECVSQTEAVACAQWYWKERLGMSASHKQRQ